MKRSVRRVVFFGSGLALMLLSLPLYISPLPLGLVIMLAGIYLLSKSSPRLRWAIRRLRRRFARSPAKPEER